ncbi:MAG: hypothetical protein GKS00_22170 [Alphaproteobacteria bacterium]|nr:hypothetical protein [Alphaproteobacteria bacterium]
MSKFITANELASKSITELRALFRAVHDDLTLSDPGTPERLRALASLENVSRALAAATNT